MEWITGIVGLLIGLCIVAAILGGLLGGKSFGETLAIGFKELILAIFVFFLTWGGFTFAIQMMVDKSTTAQTVILIAGVMAFVVNVVGEALRIYLNGRDKSCFMVSWMRRSGHETWHPATF
jgi:hypothetical protein